MAIKFRPYLLFVLFTVAALPASAEESEVGCDSLQLQVTGSDGERTCFKDVDRTSGSPVEVETLVVGRVDSFMVVVRTEASRHTGLWRASLTDLLTVSNLPFFSAITNRSEAPRYGGFEIMSFDAGLVQSPDVSVSCAAFLRYGAHLAQSLYRKELLGFYCRYTTDKLPQVEIQDTIDSVRD